MLWSSWTSSRRPLIKWGVRLIATLSVVLVASWGTLAHTLRLQECESNGAMPQFKLVLAHDECVSKKVHTRSSEKVSGGKTAPESPKSELMLNAVSENLETAHGVTFEIDGAPEVEVSKKVAESHKLVFYKGSRVTFQDGIYPRKYSRGPPCAVLAEF